MAYTIRYSDFVNKGSIVIEDNTINQETSLNIPGRNTTAYGSSIAENFLHLLENFANSVQPVNPVEGQLWYDNTPGVDQLKLWDGTTWVAAGGLKKANLAPDAANSVIGDLWVDTDNQQLYLFAGSGWVLVGPEFAEGLETGTRPSTITAIDNNDYNVIFVEVKGKPVAVVSGEAFTPKAAIDGFIDGIRPGINLSSSNIEGDGIPQFNGISEKSLNLFIPGQPVITAANVMRKDAENIANAPLKIKNVAGVSVGISNELKLQIDGTAGVLQHDISGSNLQIRMNNAGTTTTVITVDSTEKVGINNPSPQKELDVVGTIQALTAIKSLGTIQSPQLEIVASNNGSLTLTKATHAGRYLMYTASSGTITLPATSSSGEHYTILNLTNGNITVAHGGNNINGAGSNITVGTFNGVTCISTSNNDWIALGV